MLLLGNIQIFNIYFHASINVGIKRLRNLLELMANSLMTKSRDDRVIQTWIQILVLSSATSIAMWMTYFSKMDQR